MGEPVKISFSKPALQALKPQEAAYIAWDEGYPYDGSLGARVSPSGDVSMFIQYRVNGKQSKKTLHRLAAFLYSGASISALRKEARDFVLDAQASGLTTTERAKAAKAEHQEHRAASASIATLGEDYLALREADSENFRAYADGGRAARKAVERAAAIWGEKAITQLVGADAKKLLDHVHQIAGPEAAIQTRRLLQPMLRYASIDLGLDGVKTDLFATARTKRNNPRVEVMTPEERVRFFAALKEFEQPRGNRTGRRGNVREDSADLLRLIYLTAARQGEWYKAQWHEIDLEKGEWWRPEEKRKKRNAHRMVLPTAALAVIERIRGRRAKEGRASRPDDYVFPSVQVGCFGEDRSKPHRTSVWAAFQRVKEIADIKKDLTIHDLRASRVTEWNRERGLDFTEIGKAIGSSPEVLQRVYGREPDSVEKRRARIDTPDDEAAL